MDQHVENGVEEQVETLNPVAETLQVQAQQAGEETFAAAKDLGDNVRAAIEKSLNETRARYSKTKSALDETTAAIETSMSAAREGVMQLNAKAIEAIKADAHAQFDLLTASVSAKSLSELVTLNTEFVRKRFEDATARAKTFSEFARKVADETASPIREQLGKTFKFAS